MALLALWTFAPVVWLLTRTHSGDLYTGADGPFAGDALQYLSWIRESGNHVLVANRFDTAPAGHVFLHPMFLLSGLLWKAGLPLQVAYLLWKPVAIVGVVPASAAYARRLLPERTRDVPLALVLALLTNVLFNTTLSDMETGYKAFRSDVLRSLDLSADSFAIEPEITAKVCKRKLRVYELPISYYGRTYAEGKKITWRDGFAAIWMLLKVRLS